MPTPVVYAENLVRSFGRRRAVDRVSVSLQPGECLALFGPNGAGKTTLLKMLGGLIRPTEGEVRIAGHEPGGDGVRGTIGIVSHYTMLYDSLTPLENVEFFASLYGLRNPREAAIEALKRMGSGEYMHLPVKKLSRGMQQRVSIARAVVHKPSVILADEPFTGLDASGSDALTGLFREVLADGAAVVVVTHNLDEALSICTQAAIMRKGSIVSMQQAPFPDVSQYVALYRELSVDAA